MPYITREDGERFVIPSYRDVLSEKKISNLRKEIQALSANYGEYVNFQRKSAELYEVAFSPDPGYLLGESVWHFFKRPSDLIYCEEIPNTSEVILVIVRSGNVYLDGTFSVDAIAEELVIFRTQQIEFEIYIYGDIPISEHPVEGKFNLDASTIKSFTILGKPVFPTLPTLKAFQLQLVDVILKETREPLPIKTILIGFLLVGIIWIAWYLLTSKKEEIIVISQVITRAANPYQSYLIALNSPNPSEEIKWVSNKILSLTTIPGWTADSITFENGILQVGVRSKGARTDLLFLWAEKNKASVTVTRENFSLIFSSIFPNRPIPTTISRMNNIIATLVDTLSYIVPGNNLAISPPVNRGVYHEQRLTINFNNINAATLDLIGNKIENLPLVLIKISINVSNDSSQLSGLITLKALGI